MKITINYIIGILMLFAFGNSNAQNIASINGNWDSCATWGNPTSIIQNISDTKTINNGVTVAQNTNWSTQNVTFVGNGAVSLASTANSINFVTDLGNDQACTFPCTTPSGLAVSGGGTIGTCQARTFVLTGTNTTSATWAIAPTNGVTSATSGTGKTANITFNDGASGNYTVTFTASSSGSCTTTTATKSTMATVTSGDAYFTAYGSSTNSLQDNATHSGTSNCFVEIQSGGFRFLQTGSYTFSGTIVTSNDYGASHVRFNRVGILADNSGPVPFSFTVTRNAGDADNYFWMYSSGGGHLDFTLNDGKIHKN